MTNNNNNIRVNEGTENTESFVGTQLHQGNKKFINQGYVYAQCAIVALGMTQFGNYVAQFGTIQVVFGYLLSWEGRDATLYPSLVTTVGNVGAIVGSLIAPYLMQKGKRKAIILLDALIVISLAVTAFMPQIVMPVHIVAKFFQGIAGGAVTAVCPTMINEFAPIEMAGVLGGFNQVFAAIGFLLSSLLALPIPGEIALTTKAEDPSYADEFIVSDYWRIIQFAPAVIAMFQIIMLMTCFNYESPVELKAQDRETELLQVMNKIYKNGPEASFRIGQLKTGQSNDPEERKVGYWDVLTDSKYQKATFVGIILMSFAQFSGINAVMQYSNILFTSGGSTLTTFQASTVVFTVNLVAPIVAMFIFNCVGKRPMVLISQVICIIGMLGSYYFDAINENPNALLALCIVFIVGFNFGMGSIAMPYLAEICHPYAMGLGQLANWIWVLVVGLLYPYASQEWLPNGETNLIFAGLSVVGLLFLCFNFKETRGKTPEQIQRMFQPD